MSPPVDFRDPVLLGGLAYSGKTQLRIALGAHDALSMTRRTRLWDLCDRFGERVDGHDLERCLDAVFDRPGVQALDVERAAVRRRLGTGPWSCAEVIGAVHAEHAHRQGKRRWGDQMKGVERHADIVLDTFPAARVVHLVRDPRRVADGGSFGVGPYTARWLESARLAVRNRERYPRNYLVVRYEDLARDPAATVALVLAFVGEARTDAVDRAVSALRFGASPAGTQPEARARFVDRYAQRELRALGYSSPAPWVRRRARAADVPAWAVNRIGMVAARRPGTPTRTGASA